LYRWAAQQYKQCNDGAHEILALVPRHSNKGNRTERLSQVQLDCMQSTFKHVYKTSAAPNYKACYRHLQSMCSESTITAPSYQSFIKFIKEQANDSSTRTRMGKRFTYQQAGFYHTLEYTTPIHGTRPFQCVHIDHTVLDIELKSRRTGKSLGRPWLTLVIDAFSRRVLNVFITFDAPSRASVFMAVRALVKRWGRLPEMVMTDNGKDLVSIDIRSFFSSLGVDSRYRPAAKPRYGAFMERFFGTLNTQLLHNLNGNTKILRNVRQATQSHLPRNLADWNLENLYNVIEAWLEVEYDQHQHPALGMSPKEAFDKAQRETGIRPHKLIAFNQDFLVATCPTADRQGIRTVDGQRGVKVNNYYYFTPELRDPEIIGHSVKVRVDPTDAATVYVQVHGKWLGARCAQLRHLPRMNLRQLEAVTAEYRKRYPTSGQIEHSGQRLQEYVSTFNPAASDEQAWQGQMESVALQQKLGLLGMRSPESAIASDLQDQLLTQSELPSGTQPESDGDVIWTDMDSLPDFGDL
jgi:putative transposase